MAHRPFDQAAAIAETALGRHFNVRAGADKEMTADLLALVQGQSSEGGAALEPIGQQQAAFG